MGKFRQKQRKRLTKEVWQDATKFIDSIRGDDIHLGDALQNPEVQRLFKMAESHKAMLNSVIPRMAYEIYSEPGRYIFELIQNADDCEYSIAKKEGEVPMLEFHLTQNFLTVSSNEDGFNESNIESICRIAMSSKDSGKHTGHKGIGFKSVFAIARKVYVESDPYSFSFTPEYDGKDKGLSLLKPQSEMPGRLDDDLGSRLRLSLRKESDYLDQRIMELEKISASILLFLKKLRRIVINIDTPTTTSKVIYHREDDVHLQENQVHLRTLTECRQDTDDMVSQSYWIDSQPVKNIPLEAEGPQAEQSYINLAFPIEETGEPQALQNQLLYACLPIQSSHTKFAIDADFHLTTSRQELKVNKRNQRLLSKVTAILCERMVRFAKGPEFRYDWLRFLDPKLQQTGLWSQFEEEITTKLQDVAIFWSRDDDSLHKGRDSYFLTKRYRSDEGEALFPCDESKCYLAREYSDNYIAEMGRFGVREMTFDMFLAHFKMDLLRTDSLYKAYALNGDSESDSWHEKVTEILLRELRKKGQGSYRARKGISKLEIIPLCTGEWVAYEEDIGLNTLCVEHTVPEDIQLRIVDNKAIPMDFWRPVFEALGMKPIQPSDIIDRIEDAHNSAISSKFTNAQLTAHLKYLFFNGAVEKRLKPLFKLLTHSGAHHSRGKDSDRRFYFAGDDDPFGLSMLLQACKNPAVKFLHPRYLKELRPGTKNQHHVTWHRWLTSSVGVRTSPPLFKPNCGGESRLSVEFEYMRNHFPEEIAKMLQQHASVYRQEIRNRSFDLELIKNIKVPTASGRKWPLCESYFPTTDLTGFCEKYNIRGPILSSLTGLKDSGVDEQTKGLFEKLGVGTLADMRFYVKALIEIQDSTPPAQVDSKAVRQIYGLLESRCAERSRDRPLHQELQKWFEDYDLIFHRDQEHHISRWLPPSQCIWDKYDALRWDKTPIYPEYPALSKFFHDRLDLDTPSLSMCVDVLEGELRNSETDSHMLKKIMVRMSSVIEGEDHSDVEESSTPADDLGSDSDDDSSEGQSEHETFAVSRRQSDAHSSIPDDDDVTALRRLLHGGLRFLPVRTSQNGQCLVDPNAKFVIIDLSGVDDNFNYATPILDLTLPEIRKCADLIKELGLASRRLSVLGKWQTKAGRSSLDEEQTEAFRLKAAAFCGCLKEFAYTNEDRLLTQYNRLSGIEIRECLNLTKRFCFEYDSRYYEGRPVPARLKFYCKKDSVYCCLPESQEEKTRSRLLELPKEMIEFLELRGARAKRLITMIVNSPKFGDAEALLKEAEVYPWTPDNGSSECGSSEVYRQDQRSTTSSNVEDDENSDEEGEYSDSVDGKGSVHEAVSSLRPASPTKLPQRFSVPYRDAPQSDTYLNILEDLLGAAQTIEFPQSGSSSHSTYSRQFDCDEIAFQKTWSDKNRNPRIGAAGELFVFEFLQHLLGHENRRFSLKNWTSSKRQHVNCLEEYKGLSKWGRPEITDIVYKDRTGLFTKLLVEHGYLQSHSVASRATYFIEVKASLGQCKNNFYVSQGQYETMESMAMGDVRPNSKIYVLFRVFNIAEGRVGLRIFVDPWKLRGTELYFTQSPWTVSIKEAKGRRSSGREYAVNRSESSDSRDSS